MMAWEERSLSTGGQETNWSEVEADFRRAGFLSPSAEKFREHFRNVMADWFALATQLNEFGQRMYVECSDLLTGKHLTDPTSLALQMMPRCLNAFQATILLAELGLGLEAQAHVRSLFETAYWMGYVGLDPTSAVPRLKRDTLKGEIGLFEASLAHLGQMEPETREEVVRQLTEMKAERDKLPRPLSIEELAAAADYGPSYFFYKDLSGAATHLSLKSIHVFLHHNKEGDVVGHQVGPDEESTGKAVWLGCRAMTLAIDALGRAPGCSSYGDALRLLNEQLERLEPYNPNRD
jgi:hypothetical protein